MPPGWAVTRVRCPRDGAAPARCARAVCSVKSRYACSKGELESHVKGPPGITLLTYEHSGRMSHHGLLLPLETRTTLSSASRRSNQRLGPRVRCESRPWWDIL